MTTSARPYDKAKSGAFAQGRMVLGVAPTGMRAKAFAAVSIWDMSLGARGVASALRQKPFSNGARKEHEAHDKYYQQVRAYCGKDRNQVARRQRSSFHGRALAAHAAAIATDSAVGGRRPPVVSGPGSHREIDELGEVGIHPVPSGNRPARIRQLPLREQRDAFHTNLCRKNRRSKLYSVEKRGRCLSLSFVAGGSCNAAQRPRANARARTKVGARSDSLNEHEAHDKHYQQERACRGTDPNQATDSKGRIAEVHRRTSGAEYLFGTHRQDFSVANVTRKIDHRVERYNVHPWQN